jgi:hypothetical protein
VHFTAGGREAALEEVYAGGARSRDRRRRSAEHVEIVELEEIPPHTSNPAVRIRAKAAGPLQVDE